MIDRRESYPHTSIKRNSGLTKVHEEVQRLNTCPLSSHRTYKNQPGDYSFFAKLWQDRMLNRRTHIRYEFQAKTRFKKAIKQVILSLRVTNVFLSCVENTGVPDNHDLLGNMEEEDCTASEANTPKPLFDPAWFKANREIRLGSETKTILSQEPSLRTSEQVQTVFRNLRTLPSFAEYPLYHQKAICQYASYQSFAANVTILKQGHRADNFYFVISGSATVISNGDNSFDAEKDGHHSSTSVSVVRGGMAFGEAAIMNNSLRNVTVVSETHIELLVVSKEDYAKVFFGTDSKSGEKEYITFLRTIDFLRDWPVDILKSSPKQSQHCYFRRGTVIVRNSNCSQWLYVVKSGVCEVLVRLNAVKPRKTMGRKMRQLSCLEELTRLTLERRRDVKNTKDKIKNFPSKEKIKNDLGDTLQTQRQRRKTLCHVPDHGSLISPRYSKDDFISSKINSIAEEEFSSDFANNLCQTTESVDTRSTSRRSSAIARLSDKFPRLVKPNAIQSFRLRKTKTMPALKSEELNFSPKSARSCSLPSTVGLSELDFEYNTLHSGRPASVSLVSRGAECIMISKKFFMEHANALTKSWIRLNVQPYLPVEKHQEKLQEKTDWEIFKQKIVNSVVR